MKESIFNIHFNYKGKNYIYNSYNNGLVSVTNINNISTEEQEYLISNKYLVDDRYDELSVLENDINNNMLNKSDTLNLTIQLTKQCNFHCTYCYQDKKISIMTAKTADNIIKTISDRVSNDKIKLIRVQYFGGEPLLNPEILLHFDNKLKKIASLNKISYKSFITTNGALLNKYLIKKVGFDRIQITLDGLQNNHNKFRLSNYFKFEDEMELVEQIIGNSQSSILFRMNVCKENLDDTVKLCNYLFNRFDNNRIDFFINRMIKFHDKDPFTMISKEEYMHVADEVEAIRKNYGKYITFPIKRKHPCSFTCGKAFMITAEGNTSICSGNPDYDDGEEFSDTDDNFYKYKINKDCKDCKILPLCLGPCAVMASKKCNSCVKEKAYITNRLKRYLEGLDI